MPARVSLSSVTPSAEPAPVLGLRGGSEGQARHLNAAMRNIRSLLAVCSLIVAFAPDVRAAPGDVYVPAHRTRDGHYVPPNVPPSSAGTRASSRPSRSTATHKHANAKLAPPLLVEARELRR